MGRNLEIAFVFMELKLSVGFELVFSVMIKS